MIISISADLIHTALPSGNNVIYSFNCIFFSDQRLKIGKLGTAKPLAFCSSSADRAMVFDKEIFITFFFHSAI